jgi:small-conductance mechanosensitive channel
MTGKVEMADSAGKALSQFDSAGAAFENGLRLRWSALDNIPTDWDAFLAALGTHNLSPWSLALLCAGAFIVTQLLSRGILYLIDRRGEGATGWRRGLARLASVLVAGTLMLLLTRFAIDDVTIRASARLWGLASLILDLARAGLSFILVQRKSNEAAVDTGAFVRSLSFAVLWALCGMALVITVQLFEAGPGLQDLVRTGPLLIPLVFLLVAAYWRHRQTVAALILAPQPESRFRGRLAAVWPWIAILVILVTVIGSQAASTLGRPLPPLATFVTLLLVLIAPHLDTAAADWAERGLESPDVAVLRVAFRRTFRFLVLVTIVSMLANFWVTPVFVALGFDPPSIAARVAGLGLIVLFFVFLWNAIGAFAGRIEKVEEGAAATDDLSEEPRSRLSTILPLIVGTSKAAIVSLGILSMMISVGINVWPIIGGLSVFGLAIGFGSQTLVKDIVAGLFFLADDAFRFGEYIETQGSKGTVEKISIRSVSLRHPRGAVASVPYGQIGKVVNFSRGWVIEKYVFRVAIDSDVDLIKKLFKKIGEEIAADPELAADLLEPFKSQGIGSVEDGTLLVRGKFKARAGHQFGIKKAVMKAVQKAFSDNGIKLVPKPLT